MIIFALVAC